MLMQQRCSVCYTGPLYLVTLMDLTKPKGPCLLPNGLGGTTQDCKQRNQKQFSGDLDIRCPRSIIQVTHWKTWRHMPHAAYSC